VRIEAIFSSEANEYNMNSLSKSGANKNKGSSDGMFDLCEIFLNIWCPFKFFIFLQ
jgi:hypothetical protein